MFVWLVVFGSCVYPTLCSPIVRNLTLRYFYMLRSLPYRRCVFVTLVTGDLNMLHPGTTRHDKALCIIVLRRNIRDKVDGPTKTVLPTDWVITLRCRSYLGGRETDRRFSGAEIFWVDIMD